MTGFDPPAFAINPMLGNIGAPLRTNYSEKEDYMSGSSDYDTLDDRKGEIELPVLSSGIVVA